MRVLWVVVLLALSWAKPALAQPLEGYFAAGDGTNLFYKIEGSGPQVLVVVHGGPGFSLESVRADFERLARGRTVIYYDQRGNGRSDLIDDASRLSVEHHIADLEALRSHFKLEKMTLLGNSWGGLLISAYAAAHPERVERLILDDAAAPDLGHLNETVAEIDRRIEQRLNASEFHRISGIGDPDAWLNAKDPVSICQAFALVIFRAYAFDPRRLPSYRADLCDGRPEAVRRRIAVNKTIVRSLGNFDYRPKVAKVAVPVLVIHGIADVIPVRASEDWARSYPNARLLIIQGAGHLAHLEQPEVFFGAVETFLAGKWPAGAEDR